MSVTMEKTAKLFFQNKKSRFLLPKTQYFDVRTHVFLDFDDCTSFWYRNLDDTLIERL